MTKYALILPLILSFQLLLSNIDSTKISSFHYKIIDHINHTSYKGEYNNFYNVIEHQLLRVNNSEVSKKDQREFNKKLQLVNDLSFVDLTKQEFPEIYSAYNKTFQKLTETDTEIMYISTSDNFRYEMKCTFNHGFNTYSFINKIDIERVNLRNHTVQPIETWFFYGFELK